MPIFYRYLIKEITMLFIAIVLILNTILLSFRLSHILTRALRGDIAFDAIWQLLQYQGIRFLTILIPLSFIIASIMTLSRMYRDHEIIALLSSGINQGSVRKAIMLLAGFVSLVLLIITLYILPIFSEKKDQAMSQAKQEASYALLDSNSFRQFDDDTVIYVGNNQSSLFENFIVWQKNGVDEFTSMIHAKTGGMSDDQKLLILQDGVRLSWDPEFNLDKFTYTQFNKAILNPPSDNETILKTESTPTSQLNNSPIDQAELQTRLNPSIALIIFSLALPLLAYTKPRKQERFQKLIPAFLIFAVYINVLDYITQAIQEQKISIYPGSYIVHAVVMIIILMIWGITRKRI